MERDGLEKFILANRESFDDAIPSLKVWAEIDRRVDERGSGRLMLWRGLRVAAGVLILLFAGAVAGRYIGQPAGQETTAVLSQIAPEFLEIAEYYEDQINRKEKILASYRQGQMVLADLEQMDLTMEELLRELLRAPKGQEEQIIENLIRSYQTKVQILERVLERVQSTQQPNTLKPLDNEVSI